MNTNIKVRLLPKPFAVVALVALGGCATNFEPRPLPADHPASAQAQESVRTATKRLFATDEITRKTNALLTRKEAPNPDYQPGGMSHDMGNMGGMDHSQMKGMEGMDHSKMQGMDKNEQSPPPSAPKTEGMDHSKMPEMKMAAPKEATGMEMKKTSDEMKKLSDEMKAKSDAEESKKRSASTPAQRRKTEAAYWTCVMHPEIHADKPGQCPKCGMTLVKKEGASR